MRRTCNLLFKSNLKSPADLVWSQVGTMKGVNAELGPWLRMTFPYGGESMRIEDAQLNRELFASWVLFAGFPIDRHFFKLERIEKGRGFLEHSSSWTERSWIHERHVLPIYEKSCTVTDRLEFEPRFACMAPLLTRTITVIFKHRHIRLRKQFGE